MSGRFLIPLFVGVAASLPAASPAAFPSVGVEWKIEVDLPGPALEAKPVTDKAPLLLRIASTQPTASKSAARYDLRYIGLVPGAQDLKNYLIRADGSSAADLPSIPVAVASVLPENHRGELARAGPMSWPFFGGYRRFMIALGIMWLAMLFPLILIGRRKRRRETVTVPTRVTFADRLRPLIDAAAGGTLSIDDQGQLERMLLGYWRQRLDLADHSPADAMAALKGHAQAGELLRALESWLHRPPGQRAAEVNTLLHAYRDAPDPDVARELATIGGRSA